MIRSKTEPVISPQIKQQQQNSGERMGYTNPLTLQYVISKHATINPTHYKTPWSRVEVNNTPQTYEWTSSQSTHLQNRDESFRISNGVLSLWYH